MPQMLKFFLLALATTINPMMLATVVLILYTNRARSMLSIYVATAMGFSLALGMLAAPLLEKLIKVSPHLSPAIDIGGGTLLLVVAFLLERGHFSRLKRHDKHPDRDPWTERVMKEPRLPVAFAMGLYTGTPGLYYVLGIKELSTFHIGSAEQFALLFAFNVIMVSPALIPLILYFARPKTTAARVDRLDKWITEHSRTLLASAAAVLGIFLAASGISKLLG